MSVLLLSRITTVFFLVSFGVMEPATKTRCYYVKGSTVPFDEDVSHEFKGHKNLSEEEIPPWTQIANSDRRTRGPVSKCLNGFLNNVCGGTVYLGILDDGTVNGFSLTQFQKDHIRLSLDDLMQRFRPSVEEHRYTVKFVPIVDEDYTEEDIARTVSYNSSKGINSERRQLPHTLREYTNCWCDTDRIAQFRNGILVARYVIEIIIKPWDGEDARNKYAVGEMKAIPMHEDETGRVHFRKHATVFSPQMQDVLTKMWEYGKCGKMREADTYEFAPSMQQLCDISKAAVVNHYEPKIDRLRQELHQLRRSLYEQDIDELRRSLSEQDIDLDTSPSE